jgi:acylphosphatase
MEPNRNRGDQPIDITDMQRLEVRVEGEVQDVGYRDFVRETARTLGVNGWVRNEDDGTVLIVAEATPDALDEFEAHLRKGPKGAAPKQVRRERKEAEGLPDPFEVR